MYLTYRTKVNIFKTPHYDLTTVTFPNLEDMGYHYGQYKYAEKFGVIISTYNWAYLELLNIDINLRNLFAKNQRQSSQGRCSLVSFVFFL